MEKEPKKEKLFDDCSNCEQRYKLTEKTCGVMVYTKQPECTYALCVCPHCSFCTRIFLQPESVQKLLKNDVPFEVQDYADENIYSDWCEVMGIELLVPHEITPRQEKRVEWLGYLLTHDLLTVEDFENDCVV